jgi:DNA-directed RNA polymerase specialized sigma24 family protein
VDVAEPGSVEGQVVVSSVLGAAVSALAAQPLDVQAVIALRYHQGQEFREIAVALQCPEAEVSRLHNAGVLAVHEAMLHAASEHPYKSHA